jgi:hypothetical protein
MTLLTPDLEDRVAGRRLSGPYIYDEAVSEVPRGQQTVPDQYMASSTRRPSRGADARIVYTRALLFLLCLPVCSLIALAEIAEHDDIGVAIASTGYGEFLAIPRPRIGSYKAGLRIEVGQLHGRAPG